MKDRIIFKVDYDKLKIYILKILEQPQNKKGINEFQILLRM
jgi:hypothetical protein